MTELPPLERRAGSAASAGSGLSDDQLGALGVRPSQHLRQLLDSVASAEGWLETLQEQNYHLRCRCLQQMRGAVLLGTMRGPFLEWSGLLARTRRQELLEAQRARMLRRCIPLITKVPAGGRVQLLKGVLRSWRGVLGAIAEENRMLDELEAHRKGRSQVLKQYHELEDALDAERQLTRGLRARCEESEAKSDRLQGELSWATSRLEDRAREVEEQSSTARLLQDQLRESQDRAADLRRELRGQAERVRRLEAQTQQDEEDRRELHDSLARAERAAEAARGGWALAREQEGGRAEAQLRQRDDRIAALEAQLLEARDCLESLSRGASAFLVGGLPRAATRGTSRSTPSCASSRGHTRTSPSDPGFAARGGVESLLHFCRTENIRAAGLAR
mmetsp:Transcript_50545/g.153775  ORF Transcript_50545/g.153775 Transcript_50545/m.153775 type:complete len:390 (-) Transcript_50545:64-1233(-)